MTGLILKGKDLNQRLSNLTVGEFCFQQSTKYEENIAQIDADLDARETYASVKIRSIRLAISLQKKGITSEDVICTCSYNSLDVTIPVISTFFLGAKTANLDPTLSSRTSCHLLKLVDPKVIFVDEESLELIEKCLVETKINCEIVVLGKTTKYTSFESLVQPHPNEDAFRPTKVNIHHDSVLFFSSGTTGLPKAICHSNYSILQCAEILSHNSYDTKVFLYYTTYYWISGIMMLFLAFIDGGTRVFARKIEGEHSLQTIEKYKVTTVFVAPLLTYKLTNVLNHTKYDLSSFTALLLGGTPLSNNQQQKISKMYPNAKVLVGYGLSEIGVCTLFDFKKDDELIRTKIGSSGKVGPGILLKIVDPNTEEILGPNQKGEIRIKSESVMKGYYKMNSCDCFDKDGFLKTGDIGYYDEDECIYVIERIKEMFKYLSWHVVPSAIEAVILEHPAVKECVVFGVSRGDEGDAPAAAIVLKKNCNVTKEEIDKFVAERVSDREKLRGGIVFVEYLPKTPSGKFIRNEVKNIALKSM